MLCFSKKKKKKMIFDCYVLEHHFKRLGHSIKQVLSQRRRGYCYRGYHVVLLKKMCFLFSFDDSTARDHLLLVIFTAIGGASCLNNASSNPYETSQRRSDEAVSEDASADKYSARNRGKFDVVYESLRILLMNLGQMFCASLHSGPSQEPNADYIIITNLGRCM